MNCLVGGVATQEKQTRAAITFGRLVDRPYVSVGESSSFLLAGPDWFSIRQATPTELIASLDFPGS